MLAGEVWNHELKEFGEEMLTIKNLSKDWVRGMWMNKEFMGFAFRYTRTVSHSKKSIDDEIKENPSNLMTLLTPSDVAWALLVYVNNDEYWTWKIKNNNKKKMVENAEGSESDSDRGDGEEETRGEIIPQKKGGKERRGKKLQQSGSMRRRVVR